MCHKLYIVAQYILWHFLTSPEGCDLSHLYLRVVYQEWCAFEDEGSDGGKAGRLLEDNDLLLADLQHLVFEGRFPRIQFQNLRTPVLVVSYYCYSSQHLLAAKPDR